MTTLVIEEDESSARGSQAGEPGLPGLVGADVLERHVGGGRDPISAEVGLQGRGYEDRAVLGTEQTSGRCCCASPPPYASVGCSFDPLTFC